MDNHLLLGGWLIFQCKWTLASKRRSLFVEVGLLIIREIMYSERMSNVMIINLICLKVPTAWRVEGFIDASSKTARRRIPYRMTLDKATYQMMIHVGNIQAKGYEDGMAKITVGRREMKLEFGRQKLRYQVSASWQVQDQGKTARLMLQWTEVSTNSLVPGED